MEKYITDERTGLRYELVGDYYIIAGDDEPEEEQKPIGIWGQRHLRYLKNHRKVLYANLLTSGKLNNCLATGAYIGLWACSNYLLQFFLHCHCENRKMKVSVSFDTYTFQNLVGSNTVICVRKFLHSKWQRYRTFKFYKLIICSESVSISDNRLSYGWFLYWCRIQNYILKIAKLTQQRRCCLGSNFIGAFNVIGRIAGKGFEVCILTRFNAEFLPQVRRSTDNSIIAPISENGYVLGDELEEVGCRLRPVSLLLPDNWIPEVRLQQSLHPYLHEVQHLCQVQIYNPAYR